MTSSLQRLRIGGVPEHFNLPWRLLLESGALRRAGIDASWEPFFGGTGDMVRALEDDRLDMALLLTEGAVAAAAKGSPFRIVSVYVESPLRWGIHVPANSDLQTEDDLRGNRYAISRFGSGSHLMSFVHARERGWSRDDLNFEVVGRLDGAREALADNRAQVFFWERYTTQPYVTNGEFRRVADFPTPWPCFVAAVSERMLAEAPDACAVALRAVFASAFTLLKRDDVVELVAQRYSLDTTSVEAWLASVRFATRIGVDAQMIDSVAQTLLELDLIDATERQREIVAELG
jgi:ABC-type nitrate/sulfonate/bicarbonate transport system substrate-binding protein